MNMWRMDRFWHAVARHLPRQLAYWSLIVSGTRVIRPDEEVPAVLFSDVLRRMGR